MDFLENGRGGAEGESAEGREKPPWGVPLPRAGQCPAPTKEGTASVSAVGAARPSLPPSRGKDDSHYQGEMSRRDKRGRGARPKVVTDEGDFLACTPPGGSPKGLPYPNAEGVLEIRRGGAEGESAEGREKPPWGVPLPRAGLGLAPTKNGQLLYMP